MFQYFNCFVGILINDVTKAAETSYKCSNHLGDRTVMCCAALPAKLRHAGADCRQVVKTGRCKINVQTFPV